ncbi:YvbH-like oligomerization domain-containing protein [Bacillus tuaregi]|uniref:YvbH-like oligomerization domain-containing protein n=1 Tax=Bacillus tuaregi TaxID=1816695 RepID=UPI0008F87C98|nr:YvbH-like oligomerization domain-containing protein [Bacillus tuaregi]
MYKALISIAETCRENELSMQYAEQSLNLASNTLGRTAVEGEHLVDNFKQINDVAFTWLMESRKKYKIKDFGYVFEKFINN